ncbi:MAG TPA: type II secretion system F family protein [Chloroflexota bacterium]|nr:type II secretion system F family protein [Chloroflexota bacterium]
MSVLLVTLVSGAGVALLFYGLYRHLGTAVSLIEERLGRHGGSSRTEIRAQVAKGSTQVGSAVNRFVDRLSFADRLREDLHRADLKITPGEFTVMRILVMVLAFAVGYFLIGGIFPALILAAVGFFATVFWLRHRVKRRESLFLGQLSDAVMMIASSLRAGYSMMQALEVVSREMPLPISDEFHRVTMEVGVGIPVEEALSHLLDRIHSTDLELMTIAMNVQREVGGNLAEILDTIAATIRERQELRGEVRTLTAQGRISAYIISLLPVGVATAMFFMDRPYISMLWTKPIGYVMSVIAIMLIIVGFFVTRRVAQVEV